MERESGSQKFPIGSKLPKFELLNIDKLMVSDLYLREGRFSLVVFTCNHCPYVKGSEALLVDLVREYESKGLKTVTINANDAQKYPEDSFEMMVAKAKAMSLPYPYLYDETQDVAHAFDAACTPECYLFEAQQQLIFHGTINDSPGDASRATKEHLRTALEQAFAGTLPNPSFVHPIGCSIKWK